MKKVSLSGSLRASVGKTDAADLRAKERIPCVLYGSGEQKSFHVAEGDMKKLVWSPEVYQIEIDLEGQKYNAIIQDVQLHPVTDRLVHIDFLQVVENKPIKVKLPLKLIGTAEGVKRGGKLLQNFRKLTLHGLVSKIPDTVEVAVDHLDVGGQIRVRDIAIDGVKILEQGDAVVAAVKTTRNVAAGAEGDAKK